MSLNIGQKKEGKKPRKKQTPPLKNLNQTNITSVMKKQIFFYTHKCYGSNCRKKLTRKVHQKEKKGLLAFKRVYCLARLKAKIQMHIFSTFPCYLKCSLKILSLSNNTVSEQLSRDSYFKWSGIDIFISNPSSSYSARSIRKNIGGIEHESVVVPNTSIHCLF